VNRKILVFQITCDVFSPAARGQRTRAKQRYRLGKINTTKLLAALERSTWPREVNRARSVLKCLNVYGARIGPQKQGNLWKFLIEEVDGN
jgi:hypothetical protein